MSTENSTAAPITRRALANGKYRIEQAGRTVRTSARPYAFAMTWDGQPVTFHATAKLAEKEAAKWRDLQARRCAIRAQSRDAYIAAALANPPKHVDDVAATAGAHWDTSGEWVGRVIAIAPITAVEA